MPHRHTLAATLCLLAHTAAFAIGDSGGHGGCPSFVALYAALPKGTALQVEAAIRKDLTPTQTARSWWSWLTAPSTSPQRSPSSAAIRDAVTNGPCPGPNKPLDYAVRAGNIEATQYLLDNGADPSAFDGSDTLYVRCETYIYSGTRNEAADDDPRRLQAYELTIDRGGDVNRRNSRGRNALHECHSMPYLKLLVAKGAKLDQGHLDRAFFDALGTEPGEYTARRLNAYQRIEYFLEQGLRPSDDVRRRLALPHCGHSTLPTFHSICPELHRLLKKVEQ